MRSTQAALAAFLVVFGGAASIAGEGDGQKKEEPATIWDYLTQRYDADGDGVIQREEYTRSDEKFRRLDRDGDGRITPRDFERRGRGMGMPDPQTLAAMIVARYVADDEESLDASGLEKQLAAFDADGDGRVERAEFDAEAKRRGARSGFDRFAALLEVLDGNHDDVLDLAEWKAWFRKRDADGDGVLTGEELPSPGGRRGRSASPEERPASLVGQKAPDFTLEPPEGGRAVTLSSFAGKKPVALIFGSYT